MTTFNPAETAACRRLIELALREDLGFPDDWTLCRPMDDGGDLTTSLLIPPSRQGRAVFRARAAGVLAGLPAVALVYAAIDPQLRFDPLCPDGTVVRPGDQLATVTGRAGSILIGERTALNFLQHLSGVATVTRRYAEAVAGLPARILDTRKTLPGWRLLEKYAVRAGGGHNHRMGLYDGILIKDNHLAFRSDPDPITHALEACRRKAARAGSVSVEIEVDTLEQLDEALAGRPDIILLDNMSPEQMREAVRRRNAVAPGVLLEASGGVTLDTVRAIAETGVDRISVGALTHSAPALDIALDYLEP